MRDHDELTRVLATLGAVLRDRGLGFHIAVVGMSALLLSGEGRRPTADVDVIAVASGDRPLQVTWNLPSELVEAAADVADLLDLPADWLNAGAVGVLDGRLPRNFETRLRSKVYENLVVSVLGRPDLLALKLLAAADEGPDSRHVFDVRGMAPTAAELSVAMRWARTQLHPASRELQDVAAALGLEC